MSKAAKTSTFTIHHSRCNPGDWTLAQWGLLQRFITEPTMQHAAALSRLGVQLVLSELHEPAGGSLELVGWTSDSDLFNPSVTDDIVEVLDDDMEVTEVVEIYRGPTKYAVKYAVDDGHGEFGGYEVEIKDTEAEAKTFAESLTEAAA